MERARSPRWHSIRRIHHTKACRAPRASFPSFPLASPRAVRRFPSPLTGARPCDGSAMAVAADDINVNLGILGDSQGPRAAATSGWSSARRTSSSPALPHLPHAASPPPPAPCTPPLLHPSSRFSGHLRFSILACSRTYAPGQSIPPPSPIPFYRPGFLLGYCSAMGAGLAASAHLSRGRGEEKEER